MKTKIPYYPKFRRLIPILGFKTSTEVFSYLRRFDNDFMYDRIYTSDSSTARIVEFRKEADEIYKKYKQHDKGFIFVMDVPEYNAVELMHVSYISKEKFIKYLKLRVFS